MSEKEARFWNLIVNAAASQNSVFFVDSGEGHEITNDLYDGEDFSGWLIPNELEEKFKMDWIGDREWEKKKWEKYYCFAEWCEASDGTVNINFNTYA